MAVANQGYPAGGRAYSNSLKRPTRSVACAVHFARESRASSRGGAASVDAGADLTPMTEDTLMICLALRA